ncbi:MAG: hypothetical protein KA250_06305 [Verrucomicrobiales bacterium]|nr:hypothetical protein [Verrucomicrobiales bacterium]HQZ28456.1 hypothetical protein [Verrucomicrobiales bacterium]
MKSSSFFCLSVGLLTLALYSCAMKETDVVESYLVKQDAAMKKSAKRSRERARARESRWSSFSDRADARYDSWIDSVMR